MAPTLTLISNIVPGKIEWMLKVRVIRLWTLPEYKNPSETNSIEMLLLDQNCGKIHASVKKFLIQKFNEILIEGSTYLIENLLVAQNDPKYKTTGHKFKLNFMGSTKCRQTDADDIPMNHFDFMSFVDILAANKEDLIIDVIGHVVEKDNIKENEKNGKRTKLIDIVLQDLEYNRVHCTLWGDYAEQMQQYLNSHDSNGPVIAVLQLCKLKRYFGVMGISNAFFGTKLLLNPDLTEVSEYRQKMDGSQAELTQVVSQINGYTAVSLTDDLLQTPRMTISDLIESQEKCFGIVFAKGIEVETENGWFYDSCTKCIRKASKVGNKFYCENCGRMVTVIPRFKMHVKVIDHTGSTTFIMFDRVVSLHTGKSANTLLASTDTADWPSHLNCFLDKHFLFKVEITDANIYQNWQTYTVKRLSENSEIIQQFKERHMIQICNPEEQADFIDTLNQLADEKALTAVEDVDSNTKQYVALTDVEQTPSSKLSGKRSPDDLEGYEIIDLGATQASTSKAPKLACVKIEPSE